MNTKKMKMIKVLTSEINEKKECLEWETQESGRRKFRNKAEENTAK